MERKTETTYLDGKIAAAQAALRYISEIREQAERKSFMHRGFSKEQNQILFDAYIEGRQKSYRGLIAYFENELRQFKKAKLKEDANG